MTSLLPLMNEQQQSQAYLEEIAALESTLMRGAVDAHESALVGVKANMGHMEPSAGMVGLQQLYKQHDAAALDRRAPPL